MRYQKIDLLRGVAVFLMIIFHIYYDLMYFFGIDILNFNETFWNIIGKTASILFIFLAGISGALSYEKYKEKFYKKYFFKGLKLFLIAGIISGITYYFIPDQIIIFGIIHFFSISFLLLIGIVWIESKLKKIFIIPNETKQNKKSLSGNTTGDSLSYLKGRFLNYNLEGQNLINLIIGTSIILLGFLLDFKTKNNYGFVFGFHSSNFFSADYYPLIPYFGIMIIGYTIGKFIIDRKDISIQNYQDNHKDISLKHFYIKKIFEYGGKNSLLIYLIHQPIILLLIYIII